VSRVWQAGQVPWSPLAGAPFGLEHSCQCQTKLIKKFYQLIEINNFLLFYFNLGLNNKVLQLT
jgi:hypothetical protein